MTICKNFHKVVVAAALVATMGFSTNAKADNFTRADIEKIVQEYIETHPDLLLQVIVERSKNQLQQKQNESLTKYKDLIFGDKNSPEAGNPEGDVTVVEFVDFNCGYCKKAAEGVYSVLQSDKKVRFIFKQLPILGDSSKEAAKWAMAANIQGKYIQFHHALMNNSLPLTSSLLESYAGSVGLDVARAKKDMTSDLVQKQLENDYNLAVKMGLTGTPVFVVGDKINMGAYMDNQLQQEIDAQRAKLGKK